MTSIECIWSAETILGEAPFWCPEEKVLYWVDIEGKSVMRFDPANGGKERFPQNHQFGCIVKRAKGGFIAGTDAGLAFLDERLEVSEIIADPEADNPDNRFNDGKCDRQGRFWAGSADINEVDDNGTLYRVNGAGDVTGMVNGLIVSNGLGWSPDNGTMYFTDSGRGAIYAYDFDLASGDMENRRVFAEVDEADGFPDGLCVDAEGFIWSAHWDGWRITRYDPDGRIDRVIDMPVPLVTSVAFGGENLDLLFVTTARLGLTEEQLKEAPQSGGLFCLDAGVRGLPEVPYQG